MAALVFASIVYASVSLLGGQGPLLCVCVLFIGTRFRNYCTAVDSREVLRQG
jgi:hypothetical protein